MWTMLAWVRRQIEGFFSPTQTAPPTAPIRTSALTTPETPAALETSTLGTTAALGTFAAAETTAAAAEPVATVATTSTPYLPFDMPVAETTKVVFAHYVPWLPLSPDNLPAEQDYYTTQYMTPTGEGGAHAAYGGYMRDRPLPRDPINDPDWRYLDALTEVNQAKSIGIDGFAVDIQAPGIHDTTINPLYRAAEAAGNFYIQPTADLAGPLGTYSPDQFAAAISPYLTSPAVYRLNDGRVVLGSFYAERQSVSWWTESLGNLRDDYGVEVAFVPTFLDAYSNMDAFAPISYGFSSWGARNPTFTDPTSDFPLLPPALTRHAHELGKIWMAPVAFQDNRPREGIYEESQNSVTNSNSWQTAINEGAEWVQLITWNDYAETTAMAPSVEHEWRLLDLQAYQLAQFKYGADPVVVRDAVYVSHREQFAASESTYPETLPMQIRPGTTPAVDTVEVVAFATAPATIYANVGGVVSSCAVAAGRSTCTFPLQAGDIVIGMERDGVWQSIVQSPYAVTNTPYIQDLQYNIAGGLR
jgi:hypothetical protein